MARKRYTRIPQGLWPYLGPAFDGVDMDIADLEAAVAAGGGGAGGGTGGGDRINVQNADGSWRLSRATVDTIHTAGFIVQWFTDGSAGVLPAAADGLAAGDVVNGVPTTRTTVTIPGSAAPIAVDKPGTAEDVVRLTKVDGVSWVVDGVTYASADFTAATRDIPYTKGTATTVTAKAATAGVVIDGVTSWTLTFASGTTTAGVITSDAFNLPAGTFTGRPSDAALGGSPVTTTGAAVIVTDQGTWAPKASDTVFWPNTSDGTISLRIAKLGADAPNIGGVDFLPFRAPSENGSVKVVLMSGGASAGYVRGAGGSDTAVGFTPTVQVGDTIEVRKAGTTVRFRHMRGGTELASKTATIPGAFSQSTCAIKASGAGWELDDLVISNVTA